MDDLILLKTKTQAVAAGVPADDFDPEVHLYRVVTEAHPLLVGVNGGVDDTTREG
jgi:hypothetical protein